MKLFMLFMSVLLIALTSRATADDKDESEYGRINPVGPPPIFARALSKRDDDKTITFYTAGNRFLNVEQNGEQHSKCVLHHRRSFPLNNEKMNAFNTRGDSLDILEVREKLRTSQHVVVFANKADPYYLQFFPESVIVFVLHEEWFSTFPTK